MTKRTTKREHVASVHRSPQFSKGHSYLDDPRLFGLSEADRHGIEVLAAVWEFVGRSKDKVTDKRQRSLLDLFRMKMFKYFVSDYRTLDEAFGLKAQKKRKYDKSLEGDLRRIKIRYVVGCFRLRRQGVRAAEWDRALEVLFGAPGLPVRKVQHEPGGSEWEGTVFELVSKLFPEFGLSPAGVYAEYYKATKSDRRSKSEFLALVRKILLENQANH